MTKYYIFNEKTKEYIKNFDLNSLELTKEKEYASFWIEDLEVKNIIKLLKIDLSKWKVKKEEYIKIF